MTYENQLRLWLDRAGEDPDLTAELQSIRNDEKIGRASCRERVYVLV